MTLNSILDLAITMTVATVGLVLVCALGPIPRGIRLGLIMCPAGLAVAEWANFTTVKLHTGTDASVALVIAAGVVIFLVYLLVHVRTKK